VTGAGRLILGLETSCDETSAAVIDGDRILGHVILSQDVHKVYGGVVPELAARAHLRRVDEVVDAALKEASLTLPQIDAFAVTAGPGLIGALLVGVAWAKAAAFALSKPLVAVHHMEAHLFGPALEDPDAHPPFVALLVSGGHTMLLHATEWGRYTLLGETRDDAAGEAFDKVAKMLELPYPGGPAVERLAATADSTSAEPRLPRPLLRSDQAPGDDDFYDFSFSGLKTAVWTRVEALKAAGQLDAVATLNGGGAGSPAASGDGSGSAPGLGVSGGRRAAVAAAFQDARSGRGSRGSAEVESAVAAAFQDAAVDALVSKTLRAVKETGCPRVLLGGGVSANKRLVQEMAARLGPAGKVLKASPRLSLDNGAMVARAGLFRLDQGEVAPLDVSASADLPFPGLVRRI
jgi:N6-L-threonylcarbamoyladenine synthase